MRRRIRAWKDDEKASLVIVWEIGRRKISVVFVDITATATTTTAIDYRFVRAFLLVSFPVLPQSWNCWEFGGNYLIGGELELLGRVKYKMMDWISGARRRWNCCKNFKTREWIRYACPGILKAFYHREREGRERRGKEERRKREEKKRRRRGKRKGGERAVAYKRRVAVRKSVYSSGSSKCEWVGRKARFHKDNFHLRIFHAVLRDRMLLE
jgi:hypothetical protein